MLPFYIARRHGVKRAYSIKELDSVLRERRMNTRYSPIAYALYAREKAYAQGASRFHPCPTRAEIRQTVAARYGIAEKALSLCTCLQLAPFDSVSERSQEYFDYLNKCERFDRTAP